MVLRGQGCTRDRPRHGEPMTTPKKKPTRPTTFTYTSLALAVSPHILTAFTDNLDGVAGTLALGLAGIASCLGVALAIVQALSAWLSTSSTPGTESRLATVCLAHRCPNRIATVSCVLKGHPIRGQTGKH